MNRLKKGYIHNYTGNGKGKTTAALGLALRAAGSGLKTFVAMFSAEYDIVILDEVCVPFIIIRRMPQREGALNLKRGINI